MVHSRSSDDLRVILPTSGRLSMMAAERYGRKRMATNGALRDDIRHCYIWHLVNHPMARPVTERCLRG